MRLQLLTLSHGRRYSATARALLARNWSDICTGAAGLYLKSEFDMKNLREADLKYAAAMFPKPPGVRFSYGTAGFRTQGSLLESTVFRCGLLAALRSMATKCATGLVVTASHNPEGDNGVKLADPGGGMLDMAWEAYANELANVEGEDALLEAIREIKRREGITSQTVPECVVLLARDTRPSGVGLVAAAMEGVRTMGGLAVCYGLMTTPQLHWFVRAFNRKQPFTEAAYMAHLLRSFRLLTDGLPAPSASAKPLLVDCANGVGGTKLEALRRELVDAQSSASINGGGGGSSKGAWPLSMELRNMPPRRFIYTLASLQSRCGDNGADAGALNDLVGADFVQKEKALPRNFGPEDVGRRCVSIDGDADRLVYFIPRPAAGQGGDGGGISMELFDGDKIAALAATLVMRLVEDVRRGSATIFPDPVTVGIVQTAYANGASTHYLSQTLGLTVVQTATGVKHLHREAEHFDVGIYFEANGHGTVLFGEGFLGKLEAAVEETRALENGAGDSDLKLALCRLLGVTGVMNQAVGDAISGILLVEAALALLGLSMEQWAQLYSDLPSRQLKVKVADRSVVVTTLDETRALAPAGLQDAIDARVVRVYAEATTQAAADTLAREVADLVSALAGGTK
eukprot:jgi/Mesvir1/2099/Mv16631-RA.1